MQLLSQPVDMLLCGCGMHWWKQRYSLTSVHVIHPIYYHFSLETPGILMDTTHYLLLATMAITLKCCFYRL